MGKEKIKNLLELADEIERAREAVALLEEIHREARWQGGGSPVMSLETWIKLERFLGIDDSE